MGRSKNSVGLFAVILTAVLPALARAQEAGDPCPVVTNQLVVVQPGAAVPIRLDVQDLDGAIVSIFQYPLGGTLRQSGPTDLDYVFVASSRFRATTTLTYRVQPPPDCRRGMILGTVTLAADSPASVVTIQDPLKIRTGVCGTGLFLPPFFACLFPLCRRRRRMSNCR